jgi:hypothetical protein
MSRSVIALLPPSQSDDNMFRRLRASFTQLPNSRPAVLMLCKNPLLLET